MKNRVRFLSLSLLVTFCLVSTTGCAFLTGSKIEKFHQALAVSQNTYDTAMIAFQAATVTGTINQKMQEQIMEIAHAYYQAHNAAVDALAEFKAAKTAEGAMKLDTQMLAVSNALLKFMEAIKPFLDKKQSKD